TSLPASPASSQTLTTRSLPPEARCRPSGLKATVLIGPLCPARVMGVPVGTAASFHTRTSWSAPAEARYLPSGLKATALTAAPWAVQDFTSPLSLVASHSLML